MKKKTNQSRTKEKVTSSIKINKYSLGYIWLKIKRLFGGK
jgi:hypothetical protein